ncbi:MAG: acylphosphatase [Zetaproteobacteria bacterium CG_4_9_14_3_um_filter_49_83]|nr:MAG: acylphosphatase [Zetaproteobacteria bacterium CG17_big_fil_post_rev_8_21_14_2_50_50_13]PIV30984.1 MAG: acylphosphatase [Zetaproteobacteria bacterium CG02_land_8_20_14_3_00_50_9]PIY55144.1 MAG: acylphosphatase [Zetaproteobacteria bacterium CG_4_10_14_0_8_um_filter_49_80]PJA35094.1 MAG: acylphosphatase [Zetaproteobacteria bacterium CG_4_9_14_3_um_filter_49_83]
MHMEAWHIFVSGRVQGVGFRYHTQQQAQKIGIRGWVRNLPDGRVEAMVGGNASAIARMKTWLESGPAFAHVDHMQAKPCSYEALAEGFFIR